MTPSLQGALEPVLWMGFGIGVIAGAWSGFARAAPIRAIAWALAMLLVAIVAHSWRMDAPAAQDLLAFIFVSPFAGALPLGVGYYLGVSAVARSRRRPPRPEGDPPEESGR